MKLCLLSPRFLSLATIWMGLVALGQPSAFAQESATEQKSISVQKSAATDRKLPSAESLMDKHIEAIGGEVALRQLNSIELSGTLENDVAGHTFTAELSTVAVVPDKFRLMMQHSRFSLIRATNGTKAWGWQSGGNDEEGTTEWLDESETIHFVERAIFNPELNRNKLYKSIETVGVATVGERKAYEVSVTTQNGETYSRFFDAESGRLVKVVRDVTSTSLGEYKRETIVGRYEEYEGVWIPMRLEHTLHFGDTPGTQVHDFTVATINGKVNDKLFQVPPVLAEAEPVIEGIGGDEKAKTPAHNHGDPSHGSHSHSGEHEHGKDQTGRDKQPS